MEATQLEIFEEFDQAKKYLEGREDIKAVSNLERLVERAPKNFEVWLYLGIAKRRIEEYDEAIKCFKKVTELEKSNEEAWGLLTVTLVDQGKIEEAKKAIKEAARLNPSDEQILFLRDNLIHTYTKFGPFF